MDIEIQNKKYETFFKNGKFQYTFTPASPTETIKLYHMGCVGDTRLSRIQLEQGSEVTSFVNPEKKTNSLSGIFKQLRDLDVQMRDTSSDLWGKIRLNNAGAILDFYNENIKTELSTLAGNVNVAISELDKKVLKKSDVSITSNGITIGSGNTIDGRTIASIMKVQPDSIDLISPLIRVTGDMVVDGTLEGRKIKANTLETGHHKSGSVTAEIIAANAVKVRHIDIDDALIREFVAHKAFVNQLWSQEAFISNLKTINFDFTKGTGSYIQSKDGGMKWDLDNNELIMDKRSYIKFKKVGNAMTFDDRANTSSGISFTDEIGSKKAAIALGATTESKFNHNSDTFTGLVARAEERIVTLTGDTVMLARNINKEFESKDVKTISISDTQIRLNVADKQGIRVTEHGPSYEIDGVAFYFYSLHTKINMLITAIRNVANDQNYRLPGPYPLRPNDINY